MLVVTRLCQFDKTGGGIYGIARVGFECCRHCRSFLYDNQVTVDRFILAVIETDCSGTAYAVVLCQRDFEGFALFVQYRAVGDADPGGVDAVDTERPFLGGGGAVYFDFDIIVFRIGKESRCTSTR